MTKAATITWAQHDDSLTGEDKMSECARFEAMMDPVYGHYNIRRPDACIEFTPEEARVDNEICSVRYLNEAQPHIDAYLRSTGPAS